MVAFFEPARSAVIPNIVAEEDVIVGNTLSSATWSFDLAVGSVLGGIVAAWVGRDAVFALNSISFLISALLIGRMRFVSHMPTRRAGILMIKGQGGRRFARDSDT